MALKVLIEIGITDIVDKFARYKYGNIKYEYVDIAIIRLLFVGTSYILAHFKISYYLQDMLQLACRKWV